MVPTELADSLVEIGQRMDRHAWVPGSAGNLSARIDDGPNRDHPQRRA